MCELVLVCACVCVSHSSCKNVYRIAGNIGGELNLAVYITTTKLKSAKISYSHILYIRMAILYRTAKFKSANIYSSNGDFGLKSPNLIPANISGYTVVSLRVKLGTIKGYFHSLIYLVPPDTYSS